MSYDDDPVTIYLREVATVSPLTRDQERECVRHIRDRDERAELARTDLVEANLAQVVSIAEKHSSDRVHMLDLIQKGNEALMQAIDAFVASGAADFSAFAAPRIERAILDAITTPER
jgi:RNA polymerase primary sigma factor